VTARFSRDAVALALTPHAVVRHFGWKMRQAGNELRGRLCPACGPRNSESVSLNATTGRWTCFAHGCSGDLFAFVAGLLGLDTRRDWGRVLEATASIAGVPPTLDQDELERIRRQQIERDAQQRIEARIAREVQEREARTRAAVEWRSLAPNRNSAAGDSYVRSRGLDPRRLLDAGAIRYYQSGDVATALWSLGDGELVNVVRRRCTPGEPKVRGLPACPTAGSLGGRLKDITRGLVVVTEGVADTWTAITAWPTATVLGAHGACNLPKLVEAAAPRIVETGACVLFVPHRDAAGEQAVQRAQQRLKTTGVDGEHLDELELHYKDLNDAWRAGWRP
jgi:hypothetical protein